LPNQLISYTAILKKEEILEIINYSDLFIHPASIELEGIAVLEAIVCGLVPIVSNSKKAATKNFSLSEHTIFQVFDHNDLAKKIDYLLENEALRMSLRTQYIEFGKQFYRSLCMQKMEQMIVNMDSTTSVIK